MSVSTTEFWNLAVQSRLLSPQQCQGLAGEFAGMKGADPNGSAGPLAEWLIATGVITRYQGKVLLARQPGPFFYGDYRVSDRLTAGPLSGLFRAVHVPTNHPVLLHFLTGAAAGDLRKFTAIVQQCAAAAPLRSPSLVRSYHVVDSGSYKFIAMEDVAGCTLEDRLVKGPLSPPLACGVVRQLAMAVAEIHAAGQIHGELYPKNVWIDAEHRAKLMYFPLWRDPLGGPATSASPADQLALAADYLAPEVASGGHPERRSEVYSLGCLLYHLVTGQPPFPGGDAASKLARHCGEPPRPADSIRAEGREVVPQPVAQLIGYMIDKDPGKRYQLANNVADALLPYVDPSLANVPAHGAAAAASGAAYDAWLVHQPAPGAPAASRPVAAAAAPVSAPVVPAPVVSAPVGGAAAGFAPQQAAPQVGVPAIATGANPAVLSSAPTTAPGAVGSRRAQARGDRQNRQTMMLCGSILAAAAVVVFIIVSLSGEKPTNTAGGGTNINGGGNTNGGSTNGGTNGGGTITKKNGNTTDPKTITPTRNEEPITPLHGGEFWPTPTAGEPLDLRYMPSGVQAFIVLRPSAILTHPQGKYLLEPQSIGDAGTLAALGPLGPYALAEVSRLCGGLPWQDLSHVVIGLIPNPGSTPLPAVVARTNRVVALDTLAPAAGLEYRLVGGQMIVAAPAAIGGGADGPFGNFSPIKDAMTHADEPVLPRREMEALLRVSDNDRHFSMLFAPSFFFSEGKSIWHGLAEQLKDPVSQFLGDPHRLKAGLTSVHLTQHAAFFELRLYGDAEKTHTVLASEMDQRIVALPAEVEKHIVAMRIGDFARPVLFKFPAIIQMASDYTDVGTCQKHAVVRCYLPLHAAPSIALATYYALAETKGGGGPAVAAKKKTPEPTSIADVLKSKKTTLVDEDEFQRHLAALGDEFGIEIVIDGKDLESEGITRNKNTKVNQTDKSLGEVLRAMFLTVDPSDRLVYVIKTVDGKEKLMVTVRKKAAERNDPIPPEFQTKKE